MRSAQQILSVILVLLYGAINAVGSARLAAALCGYSSRNILFKCIPSQTNSVRSVSNSNEIILSAAPLFGAFYCFKKQTSILYAAQNYLPT